MNRSIVITGMVLMTLAIILGAFGAHALKEVLPIESLTSYETGVRYQVYHALAMIIIGLNGDKITGGVKAPFIVMLIGVALFSFSIYLLAIQSLLGVKLSFLGPITPLGGLLLILSWVLLIVKTAKSKA